MTGDEGGNSHSELSDTIRAAQRRTHDARLDLISAMTAGGPDSGETMQASTKLQVAVVDYWHALAPLKDEDVVEEYWDEEAEMWQETRRTVDEDGNPVREDVWVTGLDAIPEYCLTVETSKQITKGFTGSSVNKSRHLRRLPSHDLLRASRRLDKAAALLGFAPETEKQEREVVLGDEEAEDPSEGGDIP